MIDSNGYDVSRIPLGHSHLCAFVVVVVVVVLTDTRIIKSVVTGQAPGTLELRNTPGKDTNSPRWYTRSLRISQLRDAIHASTRNI